MTVRTRLFAESDEYGREYFNESKTNEMLVMIQQLVESAKTEYVRDNVVRRIGIQVGTVKNTALPRWSRTSKKGG